jgi:2-polyprenyl-3-methyl-5-hydroxy-6-metoxy-1,4-benzoquinol methylase
MIQIDKAGKSYWDDNWVKTDFPKPFNHEDKSLDNFVNLELHKYFQALFGNRKKFSILEIGCANSIWPVYFNQYFQAEVYGLDYSEVGCEKSRSLLKHYNIPGEISCADLFSPPVEMLGKFDVVISFGVVEHFENTSNCLKSCAAFVKSGGILVTLVPNIPSIIGLIQKRVDRAVYDVHVPLTKKMFRAAHQNAELDLQSCDYFMSINLNVVSSGSFSSHPLNSYLRHALSIVSKICWILENFSIKLPKNKFTSPYLIAVAKI